MTFNYSTRSQLITKLRQEYQAGRGLRILKIADWIYHNMTNAEVQAAFGVGAVVATAILNRCQTKSNLLDSLNNSVGE